MAASAGDAGHPGDTTPYAIDTIEPPFDNPWKALLFFGDHDFLPDGTAMLCTMQGDVWRVEGIDQALRSVPGGALPRGCITRSGWWFPRGVSTFSAATRSPGSTTATATARPTSTNASVTSTRHRPRDTTSSPVWHDPEGSFYTVSGRQGLLKIAPDGKQVTVLATGFRNADGVARSPEGVLTVPNSEGDWTPASMICEVRAGGHYGSGGPRQGQTPDLPLVYAPAASIAAGTPVSLHDTIPGLDDRNLQLLITAIQHAAGQRPPNPDPTPA